MTSCLGQSQSVQISFFPGMTILNATSAECFISIYWNLLYEVSQNYLNLKSDSRSLSEFYLLTLYDVFSIRMFL